MASISTAVADDFQYQLLARMHHLAAFAQRPGISDEEKRAIDEEIREIALQILWRSAHI